MILNGTFTFAGPRAVVWELLQDPAVLARALPGTDTLELDGPDRFKGVMKVSIGPVTAARFDVTVTLTDVVPPDRFVMKIDGKGGVGHARGTSTIELADDPAGTLMTYSANIQIGGTIAAIGQRMVESVGKTMTAEALASLDREVRARLAAGGAQS
jgi:hypothetical protein